MQISDRVSVYNMSYVLCGCVPVCVYLSGEGSGPFCKQAQMVAEETQYAGVKSLKARGEQIPPIVQPGNILLLRCRQYL